MDERRSDGINPAATEVADVVVIGGGSAGLSAALTLARARRSVVVLDAGEPRNGPADGIHGLLTREGMSPRGFVGEGTAEVRSYGGRVVSGWVASVRHEGRRFVVRTEDGGEFTAARLLVATGLIDELPEVPGLRERWGRDVLHCPYCHGWEVRDQPIGVLGSGPGAVHQTLLFRQWSADLTLFLHTAPALGDEQREQLVARGVSVVAGKVDSLEVTDDQLSGVRLASGDVIPVQALAVAPRFVAHGDVLADLGLLPVEHPGGFGTYIESDLTGQTAVPGVWVAGNVTDLTAGVVGAAAAGVSAAAAINADLVAADTNRAVRYHREPFGGPSEARVANRVLAIDAADSTVPLSGK